MSRETRIPMAHIEKDFWVTEVLRGVARCTAETGVTAVLKGGTSLSKAFGLIHRFSEDVDVIVVTPGESKGMDDRCLKSFVTTAAAATGLEAIIDGGTATRGVKRSASLQYPTSAEMGVLRSGVLLELGVRGGAMPTVRRYGEEPARRSRSRGGAGAGFRGGGAGHLACAGTCANPDREVDDPAPCRVTGRRCRAGSACSALLHIWCLLGDGETVEALEASPADVLAREVITFTAAARMETSNRPPEGFAASPAFDPAKTQHARSEFESVVLDQLLWSAAVRPSFEDCCAAVDRHADML